jgi:ABC-2 type transport system ATP-binding protein
MPYGVQALRHDDPHFRQWALAPAFCTSVDLAPVPPHEVVVTTPGFDPPASSQPTVPAGGATPVPPPAPLEPAAPASPAAPAPPPFTVARPGDADLVIALDHISKTFGDVVAANDISLHVARGSVLGVIGPSGAGKTTTIRIISGGLSPDTGTVSVLGEDPRSFRRRTREAIGYMPQSFVLYPDLTARENVHFMASLYGMPPWRRGKRVDQVLELVDLSDARDRRASQMSGGMQRRLELACTLVHQPSLLILDEPTAGIDPLLRTRVWQEIDRLRGIGVTILVTTQYVSEAEYCDAVALISDGELVAHATPTDLRKLALGGEVIEVGTHDPIDARRLPPIQGVTSVRQTGADSLLIVANDAGLANPLVNDAVEQIGGSVEFSREYRPTFDEVFAALVTSHSERRAGHGPDPDQQTGTPPSAPAQVV